MKVVILAGGLGTRLSEETQLRPKPMVEIGDKPILYHIMKIYSRYGFHEFVICLGYKGYFIKDYFANYYLRNSDVTFDFSHEKKTIINPKSIEPWIVTLVDTGADTMTGGRIKRIQEHIGSEPFMLTYGDGVADINIEKLLSFHRSHGKLATVTAAQPNGRFGALLLAEGDRVVQFQEKIRGDGAWVNAGFFVLQPEVFSYIDSDSTIFERDPLERLAAAGQLMAYRHTGFWHPMDTLRDKNYLSELWTRDSAPWKR